MKPEYEIFQLNSKSDPEKIFNPVHKNYELLLDSEAKKLLLDGVSRLTDFDELVAVGVKLDTIPCGLAIASANKTLERSRIIVFFLSSFDENQIGVDLMIKLLEALKNKGCKTVDFIFLKEDSHTPNLQQILQKTDWCEPKLFILRYIFSAENFNPNWLKKKYIYPEGFTQFSWDELSKKDRDQIRNKAAQKHFRPAVSPFQDEQILEPLNSLGVRNSEGIVAWILTHRIDDETLRYTAFYVDKHLRDKQITIKLLASSILLQITKSKHRRAMVEVPVTLVHPHWIYFAKKRLEPNAIQVLHLLQVGRKL